MLTGAFLRHPARRSPSQTAVIGKERRLSYEELDAEANRFAHTLSDLGLEKGGRIAILSTNRPEYAIAYFGSARSGCVLAHISIRSTADDLAQMLNKVGAELLLFEARSAAVVGEALERVASLRHLLLLDEPTGETGAIPNLQLFSDLTRSRPVTEPAIEIADTDPLGITFTGGTTGSPKGVLVSHRARAATAYAAAIEFGLSERDVVAATTPLFHTAGLYVWFVPAIMLGTSVVMLPTWDVENFMDLVEKERVTAAFFVPSQLHELISHEAFSADRLSSLCNVGYAGSPMGASLFDRVQAALPHVEFTENYGQSETCPLTVRRPWHPQEKRGTVGRAAFNVEIAVVDEEGNSVPAGVAGEIITRGEQLFEGYVDDPDQTAEAFRHGDGWLWTGDVGCLDEDGFLTLIDRSKDMLVSGGENVYPAEIENALYRHDAVAECAVFGIPDERWGEVPAAHIVLAQGVALKEEEIISFCTEQVPRHKRPRVVKFVERLPRTPVGKVNKAVLREEYWRGREKKI